MSNPLAYIVPINVQALKIAPSDTSAGQLKGPEFDFTSDNIDGISLGSDVMQPFATGANDTNIKSGIRLQWELPKSLLQHNVDPATNTSPALPQLPNRWLVTAFYPSQKIYSWVIESDTLSPPVTTHGQPPQPPDAGGPVLNLKGNEAVKSTSPIPLMNLNSYSTYYPDREYLGTYSDASSWSEPGSKNALNALSYYGPSLTAYYPHCANVFGFYDDLSASGADKENANLTVSYQVVGWYSESSDDPIVQALAHITAADPGSDPMGALTDYIQQEWGWQLVSPPEASADLPSTVVSFYCGMVVNISYETTSTTKFLSTLSDQNISVSIGNNMSEALAAQICKDATLQHDAPTSAVTSETFPLLEEQNNLEFLINAFQQDLLRRLKTFTAGTRLVQLESMMHANRFGRYRGGSVWAVRAKPSTTNRNPSTQATEVPLPLAAAQALSKLNTSQAAYDQLYRQIETASEQLFLDWANGGSVINTNVKAGSGSLSSDAQSFLMAEMANLFVLQSMAGVLTVTPPATKEASFSLTYTPFGTVANEMVDCAILGTTSTNWSNCESQFITASVTAYTCLEELYVNLGVKLPAAIKQLKNLVATFIVDNPSDALPVALSDIETILNDSQTYLGSTDASLGTTYSTLITLLTAQKSNISSLCTTLQGYTEGTGGETNGDLYNTAATAFFSDAVSQDLAPYNTIYDTQMALVYLEALLPQQVNGELADAASIAYGYAAAAYDYAYTALNNLNTLLCNLSSIHSGLGGATSNFSKVGDQLSAVQSAYSTFKTSVTDKASIGTLKTDFQTLCSAIEAFEALQSELDSLAGGIYTFWSSLLEPLPTGQQVQIVSEVMQSISTALAEPVVLQQKQAPPFHLPTEPVLAFSELSSETTRYLQKVNRSGISTNLPCRLPSDLVSSLVINSGNAINAPAASTFGLPNSFPNDSLMVQILGEGYLLAPEASNQVLADLGSCLQGQQKNAANVFTNKTASKNITPDPTLTLSSDSVAFTGTLPYYIAINQAPEGNPFLPLYLAWSVDYQPVLPTGQDGDYTAGFLTSNFALDNADIGFDATTASGISDILNQNSISFSNQIPLADTTNYGLLNQFKAYFKNQWGIPLTYGMDTSSFTNELQKELYDIFAYLNTYTVLSQGLSGFNAALLQRIQGYQFPFNQGATLDQGNFSTGTELFNLFSTYWDTPFWRSSSSDPDEKMLTNNAVFSPMRAGILNLNDVMIVDVFGQYISFDVTNNEHVAIAKSLNPNSISDEIVLPPRFAQPMRLRFQWESAQSLTGSTTTFEEFNSHPAYSPICGWLVHNNLDNSLFTYDVSGKALGYFGAYGIGALTWVNTPTSDGLNTAERSTAIEMANPYFQNFLNDFVAKLEIEAGDSGTGATFFQTLQKSNANILSPAAQEKPSLAVLRGRPLVLVQVKLELERYGSPAVAITTQSGGTNYFSQDADHYTSIPTFPSSSISVPPTDYPVYDVSSRTTADVDIIDVPVAIGNAGYLSDGLVGFFKGTDFTNFYAVEDITSTGPANGVSVIQAADSTVSLSLANPTQTLFLLMDPRVAVHATTGILPRQSISIPSYEYQAAMDRLEVYFTVNPVLLKRKNGSTDIDYQFPLPKEEGYQWSWVQPGLSADQPLQSNTMNDKANWGFGPQQIQDGWLKMSEVADDLSLEAEGDEPG